MIAGYRPNLLLSEAAAAVVVVDGDVVVVVAVAVAVAAAVPVAEGLVVPLGVALAWFVRGPLRH